MSRIHSDPFSRPALNPGDKLGYFEVQAPLEAGGTSLVWKGYDKLLDRHVAIKQLSTSQAVDEGYRERFRSEAELHKKLGSGHRNLVEIIDYVEDERGLFIVMEYVDGESLDRMLTKLQGPVDPKQAVNLLQQVAVGLKAIHQAGVIHRDLKPANILLTRDGGVKICDFGLAALQDEQDAMAIGTTRYMAPELFGEESATPACDIYSLGMIAYEVLIGRDEFEQAFRTVLRDQRNQALRWMKWHTNMRLTAPKLTELNPKVPPALEELVERMMAKDQSQRINSADQLLQVIKRVFVEKPARPASAPPPSAARVHTPGIHHEAPTAPLPQRSKLPLILAINAGVLLLIMAGVLVYVLKIEPANRREALVQQASKDFAAAKKLEEERQFQTAAIAFKALADQWPDHEKIYPLAHDHAQYCYARVLIATADDYVANNEFDLAVSTFDKARQALLSIGASKAYNPDTIGKLTDEANNRQAFAREAALIASYITDEEFTKGRLRIRDLLRTGLTDAERAKLEELGTELEARQGQNEVDTVLARAQALRESGRLSEAVTVLRDAQQKFATAQKLQDTLVKITEEIDYATAISAAEQAEAANRLANAITEYQKANRIRPSGGLDAKVRLLQARQWYQRAADHEARGERDLARDAYLKASGLADMPEAIAALDRLKVANQRETYVQAGETAYAAGDYQSAINQFTQAQRISATPEVQRRMNTAQLRLNVQAADDAMKRWDLVRAEPELAAAKRIDENDVALQRALEEYNIRKTYIDLRESGDRLREKGLYGDAADMYRRARDTIRGTGIDTTEIDKRIQDNEYDSLVARAKHAIDSFQWRRAHGLLKAAQGMRNTGWITEKIAEVEAKLAELERNQ